MILNPRLFTLNIGWRLGSAVGGVIGFLVLTKLYAVPGGKTGLHLLPFALGNSLGPIALGRFFDTIGRRKMICGTYAMAALLLATAALLFNRGAISALQQTVLWIL